MRSALPKVLHAVAGRSMLAHALATARAAGPARLALVVAPGMEAVRAEAAKIVPDIAIFEQPTQEGTAQRPARRAAGAGTAPGRRHRHIRRHAAAAARDAWGEWCRRCGTARRSRRWASSLPMPPATAGSSSTTKGASTAIREHNDASEAERRVGLCNAGAMAFRVGNLVELLSRISNSNAKSEYYLTDIVAIGCQGGACRQAGALRAGRGPGHQLARAAGRGGGRLIKHAPVAR